jgi:Putative peptidoglycan binding domain
MKKFIAITIGCSLIFAVGALAQQDDTQQQRKKKHQQKAEAAQQGESPAGKPARQMPAAKPRAKERAAAPQKSNVHAPEAGTHETNTKPKAGMKAEQKQARKERKAGGESATTDQATAPGAKTKGQSKTETTAATSTVQTSQPSPGGHKRNGQPKKADVQKIKTEHASFRAQPKPKQVPAVTFSESRQITGADRWQGQQYSVFRSYHPQRHDQNWYRSHYTRIELIAGGYYFFDNGYWFPAWGYQPSAQYYAYDGPIYAGRQAEPPDRVIADVQAVLQEMGYYRGEVDGLLGPLTREALTGYQADNGLYTTATIDEPTLDSLGI